MINILKKLFRSRTDFRGKRLIPVMEGGKVLYYLVKKRRPVNSY